VAGSGYCSEVCELESEYAYARTLQSSSLRFVLGGRLKLLPKFSELCELESEYVYA